MRVALLCLLLTGCATGLPDTRDMTLEEQLMVIEAYKIYPRPVPFYPMERCCLIEVRP